MKVVDGPAIVALMLGMSLAFLVNHKTSQTGIALIAGVFLGLAAYFLLAGFMHWKKKQK